LDKMLLSLGLLLGATTLATIAYLRRNYGQLEKCGVPVQSPRSFCFGTRPWKLNEIVAHEEDMELFLRFGKVWGQYDMSTPYLSIADPLILKKIMVKSFDSFSAHADSVSDQSLRSLDLTNGQEWKDLRKALSPTFTSGKIKGMLELLDGGINQMIDHLEEVTKKDNLVEVKDVYQKMALDVIARCAFGIDSNSYKDPENKLLVYGRQVFDEFILRDVATTLLWHVYMMIGPVLEKCVDIMPEHYRHIWHIGNSICLERESRGPGSGDFIDRLIELKKRHEAGEFPALTTGQITGQSIVFLLAGFETTSNTLASLTYHLAKNPEVQETLIEEVDDVLEAHDGKVDHETITDMPYLEACIKEALRIFPPVSRNDRMCTKDWQDEGLFIPKGMMINIPTYVIHHNPEYWPEPELFKPERFLKENADQIVPYSWLPFGAGPRACIGERFAMAEMKMALAKVVSKFRVEADETTKIEFQKGDQAMMSYHGVYVRMVPR